jgi:hypothetical protein
MPVKWSQDISYWECNFLAHAHVNICWKIIFLRVHPSPFFLYLALLIYLLSCSYLLPWFSTVLLSNPIFRVSPPLPFHNVKTVLGLLANNATCECNILVYEHNIFPECRVCGRRLSSKGEIFLHVGCLYTAPWNFNGRISQFPSMYVQLTRITLLFDTFCTLWPVRDTLSHRFTSCAFCVPFWT